MQLSAFIHQKSYEKIVYKLRKHPITILPAIFSLILVLIAPPIFFTLTINNIPNLLSNDFVFLLTVMLGGIYYLATGLFYYTFFVNFYLDLLIITNDRLMHIEQVGIFSRSISEVDLYKIQDITSTINGFIPSMLNYGNLLIQTAGAIEKFHIEDIRDPEHLRQQILDLAEEDRKFHIANSNVTPSI